MKIHLIAIGGSAMHNMALALHHKGYIITGNFKYNEGCQLQDTRGQYPCFQEISLHITFCP